LSNVNLKRARPAVRRRGQLVDSRWSIVTGLIAPATGAGAKPKLRIRGFWGFCWGRSWGAGNLVFGWPKTRDGLVIGVRADTDWSATGRGHRRGGKRCRPAGGMQVADARVYGPLPSRGHSGNSIKKGGRAGLVNRKRRLQNTEQMSRYLGVLNC
jgi:hypothetical protein